VRLNAETKERTLDVLRWGLIPFWAKDAKIGYSFINARAGGINTKWTRLSCRSFAANAVRLQLRALASNLGNFMRTLATPETVDCRKVRKVRPFMPDRQIVCHPENSG
jgi:SOS response associated peptidase (SRAP)